jgi:hypothetical protein
MTTPSRGGSTRGGSSARIATRDAASAGDRDELDTRGGVTGLHPRLVAVVEHYDRAYRALFDADL